MTQLVAGMVAFLAVVAYGWAALRSANYPTPWSAPWHTGALSRLSAAGNAAVRLVVLGGLAVLLTWPYVHSPSAVIPVKHRPPPVVAFHPGLVDPTWLLPLLAVAGLVALIYLVARFVPRRWGRRQKSASA